MASGAQFAYIGCFTTEKRKARGKGISVYRIDGQTGAWTLLQVLETIPNPQFIAFDREQRFLYSAHGDGSEIGAYAIDKTSGTLKFLNSQPVGGVNSPCVTVDPGNRYVVLANGPGLAAFPRKDDGSLAPASAIVFPPGKPGSHVKQQKGPHPHQVIFDPSGRFILAADRDFDRIHIYRLDTSSGKLLLNDPPAGLTRSGAGPRHVTFHPGKPWCYVANELDSTVGLYEWDGQRGEMKPLEVIPSIPATFMGNNTAAEIAIAPSGKFVHVSNRGHDSIGTFAVNASTGTLTPVAWESTGGKVPRFFTLDASGTMIYAANQDSHTIVVFRVDGESGKLAATGQVIETGSPSCILFA